MRSLDAAREACDHHHPGLLKALHDLPLMNREAAASPVVDIFRTHGGPALLVPREYGGLGVDALQAVRVSRGIGAASPSLGAAATMHNFTVAMLFALTGRVGRPTEEQVRLLGRIAPEGLLLASGWAEGRTEQNILSPAVTARRVDGGFVVNGAKKPCSLSSSMEFLTASAILPDEDGRQSLAILLIPAEAPGVTVHPFWGSEVLAAAQSHEVRLTDVFVPEHLIISATPEDPGRLDDLQTAAFVWFELLVTSAYVGAASTLVERVLANKRGSVTDRAAAGIAIESAVALTEGMARSIMAGSAGDEAVAGVLVSRYAVQQALATAADLAVELLGGIAFIESSEIAYLTAAVRPLAYHPPSRTSTSQALVDYLAGGPLILS
jgi:alkylation response protein AidB-like acyl-CoA dehydrogenase